MQELRDELKAEKSGALDLIKNEEQNVWNRLEKEEAKAVREAVASIKDLYREEKKRLSEKFKKEREDVLKKYDLSLPVIKKARFE